MIDSLRAPPLAGVTPVLREALSQALADEIGFASLFYQQLFQLAPDVRSLFPADLRAQQEKLGRSLWLLLRGLDDPAALVPELAQLGARHVRYGVRPAHYLLVGQALADALAQRLGQQRLEASLESQWQQLYGWIAATMLAGMAQQEAG